LSASLGVPPDDLLKSFTTASSSYPTRECLQPEEVADYQAGRPIGADRVDHASSCQFCHPMLEVSAPGRSFRDAFLAEIAHAEAAEPRAPLPAQVSEPRSLLWAVRGLAAAAVVLLATNVWTVARVGALSGQIAAMHVQPPIIQASSTPPQPATVDQAAIIKTAVDTAIREYRDSEQSASTQAILAAVDKRVDARMTSQISARDTDLIADRVARKLRDQQILTVSDQAGTPLPTKRGVRYFPTYLYTEHAPTDVLNDGTIMIPTDQTGNILNYGIGFGPDLKQSKQPAGQNTAPKTPGTAVGKTP
jgi:hypothetical protein